MARFDSGKATIKTDNISELERQQKEMLKEAKRNKVEEVDEAFVPQTVAKTSGTKISTSVGKNATPKSYRLDQSLIMGIDLLVNHEKLFSGDLKCNANQIVATAIKEYLEKTDNKAKINKMLKFQNNGEL